MAEQDVIDVGGALVRRSATVLQPVMSVQVAMDRIKVLQDFCEHYLVESRDGGNDGGDYGVIPGTGGKKKVLFKSGADKLCDVYGLVPVFTILRCIEDFETGLFDYVIECRLLSKVDDSLAGTGLGSCSSYESKYRFRDAGRTCPTCGTVGSIIRGKAEYGGGFLCWKKKDGCGAKFKADDQAITSQPSGRIVNPDIIDTKNTVLKIAEKRSKGGAVIGATRSSGIFTVDLEDHVAPGVDEDNTAAGEGQADSAGENQTSSGVDTSGMSQKEKIAAIKAAAKGGKPVETKAPVAAAPGPAKDAKPAAPAPASATQAKGPVPVASAPKDAPAAKDVPAGALLVTAVNVQTGPMVMDAATGTQRPLWGPIFCISFNSKVTAEDGTKVRDVVTEDVAIAEKAEHARSKACQVKVVPGKKPGTFELVDIGFAAD